VISAVTAICYCFAGLQKLGAAHPLPYFSLIDCCSRCRMDAAGLQLAAQLLQQGACQPPAVMLQLLARPAAVAALTSAVAGLVKAWAVAMMHEAASHFADLSDEVDESSADPATEDSVWLNPAIVAPSRALHKSGNSVLQHSVKLPWLMADVLVPLSAAVSRAVQSSGGGSSSSSNSQVTASARLLLVLVARSLHVFDQTLQGTAGFAHLSQEELLAGSGSSSATWQQYQASHVSIGRHLMAVLQPAVQQQQQQGGACCWPHLLQLHDVPLLVAAVQQAQQAYVDSCWQFVMDSCRTSSSNASSSSSSSSSAPPGQAVAAPHPQVLEQQKFAEQHRERLEGLVESVKFLCWMLTEAVPLPEVCNNPGCQSLQGVLEAAAAVKACGGCGARYCSRKCQQADWDVHRKACRRLRGIQA
jgi:hypothetical protein